MPPRQNLFMKSVTSCPKKTPRRTLCISAELPASICCPVRPRGFGKSHLGRSKFKRPNGTSEPARSVPREPRGFCEAVHPQNDAHNRGGTPRGTGRVPPRRPSGGICVVPHGRKSRHLSRAQGADVDFSLWQGATFPLPGSQLNVLPAVLFSCFSTCRF